MKGIKVYIDESVEKEFRKTAMKIFGYGKGSLSKAAEIAFKNWVDAHSTNLENLEIPEDPVKAISGQLEGVTLSSVDLQHKVKELRANQEFQ
ncbi:MAG: hypothetical protein ACTSW1_04795 [Candidatus Hodarchaeales archaeon]